MNKNTAGYSKTQKGLSLAETLLASFLFLLILGIIANAIGFTARMASLQLDDNRLKRECLLIVDQLVSDMRGCDLPVLSYRSGTLNQHIGLPYKTSDQETNEARLDSDAVAGLVFNDHRGDQITYALDSHGTLSRTYVPANGAPTPAVEVAANVTSLSFEPFNAGLGLKDRHWKIGVSVGNGHESFPANRQFKISVAVRADVADVVRQRLNPPNEPPSPTTTSIGGATTSVPPTTTTVSGGLPNIPNFRSRIIVLTGRQITIPGPPRITVGGVGGVSLPSIGDIMYSLPGSRTHSWHGGTYDCWGLSDLMFNAFTSAGYGARILTFATSYSSNHRQVQVFYDGGWHDVDPRDYGYDWLFATRSAPPWAGVIAESGGADFTRANQLTNSMNWRLTSFYQLVNDQLLNKADTTKSSFDSLRTISGQLNGGSLNYNSGMTQLTGKVNDINEQYIQIKAQIALANQYLQDQRNELNEVNAIGAGNPVAAGWAAGLRNAYNQLADQVHSLNVWFSGYRAQVSEANQWLANAQTTNDQLMNNYDNAVAQTQQLQQTVTQMSSIVNSGINPVGAQIAQNTQSINNLINQMNSGSIPKAEALAQIEQLINDNQSQVSQAGDQMTALNTYGQDLQSQYNQLKGITSNLSGFTNWNKQAAASTQEAISSLNAAQNLLNEAQQTVNSQQSWLESQK